MAVKSKKPTKGAKNSRVVRVAKKQVSKKKTAVKKASPKSAPAKKPQKRIEPAPRRIVLRTTSKVTELAPPAAVVPVTPEAVIAPALPARAPVRKIMGEDRALTIVPKLQPLAAVVSEPLVEPELIAVIPVIPKEELPETKSSWENLPRFIPTTQRFLLGMALKECLAAADWPFPFAKFISSLPAEICGVDMTLLLLGLENSPEEIAEMCGVRAERIQAHQERGETVLRDSFAAACPEIGRKWGTQLSGLGMGVEPLIERYLVSKVDRNFQMIVGALILRAMGAKNAALDVRPMASVTPFAQK